MPRRPQEPGAEERLARYRAKRSADRTPEPFGGEAVPTVPADAVAAPGSEPAPGPPWARPRLFFVQKHAAHAPALGPAARDRRRAALVGGAEGAVARPGRQAPRGGGRGPPARVRRLRGGHPRGQLRRGRDDRLGPRRLRARSRTRDEGCRRASSISSSTATSCAARWTLVRTKSKGQGRAARTGCSSSSATAGPSPRPRACRRRAIFSGLTVEELRGAGVRAAPRARSCVRLGAPRPRVLADDVEPDAGRDRRARRSTTTGWLFELKYDGFRVLAAREDGQPRLRYRSGSTPPRRFPEVARALSALPYAGLVLDGEIVVLDERGPARLPAPAEARAAAAHRRDRSAPPLRAAGDATASSTCSAFEGFDLRGLPLVERKALLQRLLPARRARCASPITSPSRARRSSRRSSALRARGRRRQASRLPVPRGPLGRLAQAARASTRATSRRRLHRARGHAHRLRRAAPRRDYGHGRPRLRRPGRQRLRRRAARASSEARLEAAWRETPPCAGRCRRERGHVLGRAARSSAEVRYNEWTDEGLLRQPVFLRLRDDKPPAECRCAARRSRRRAERRSPPGRASRRRRSADWPRRRLRGRRDEASPSQPRQGLLARRGLHQGRPGRATTARSRPGCCRICKDRPLVLTRYPDGIAGKTFFQKDAPGFRRRGCAPSACGASTASARSTTSSATTLESLLYVANLGTIPLHVWAQPGQRPRAPRLVHPRSRPQGRPVRPRGARWRARSASCARRSALPALREDLRLRPGCTC